MMSISRGLFILTIFFSASFALSAEQQTDEKRIIAQLYQRYSPIYSRYSGVLSKRKVHRETFDPETGEKIVENIYTREEIYEGEKMDEVPDIVVETPGYNHIARFGFGKKFLRDPVEKSAPVKEGFMMSNRELSKGNVSIVDLSTSIAGLLGSDFGEGENVFKTNSSK